MISVFRLLYIHARVNGDYGRRKGDFYFFFNTICTDFVYFFVLFVFIFALKYDCYLVRINIFLNREHYTY